MPTQEEQAYRMLVVDDDPDIAQALEDYFDYQGYAVEVARDGAEALEKMQQQPSFDIVLLDVMLPHKTGFEVLQESQELGVDSPVLMLTARGE